MDRARARFVVARCPRPWSGCHLDCQMLMQLMTFWRRQLVIFPVQNIRRDSARQVAGALLAGALPLRTGGPMPLMPLWMPGKVDPTGAQIVSTQIGSEVQKQ